MKRRLANAALALASTLVALLLCEFALRLTGDALTLHQDTESYPFMIVLNVFLFTVAGVVGLAFLWKALGRVLVDPAAKEGDEHGPEEPPRGQPTGRSRPRAVLGIWTVIFAVVGAQMGWILRPFIGAPHLPFELFRTREQSFFEGFFRALGRLLD